MRRFRVAVLYTHPLFGYGIARLLAEDPRLDVACHRAEAADAPTLAATLGADVVVMEDWEDPALTGRVIQALPPALVAVVRLRDNAMEVYRGRRRFLPRADNLLDLMHELLAREVVAAGPDRSSLHHRSAS
jgi:DNA-binding NarL/FixJ family response regulator